MKTKLFVSLCAAPVMLLSVIGASLAKQTMFGPCQAHRQSDNRPWAENYRVFFGARAQLKLIKSI